MDHKFHLYNSFLPFLSVIKEGHKDHKAIKPRSINKVFQDDQPLK